MRVSAFITVILFALINVLALTQIKSGDVMFVDFEESQNPKKISQIDLSKVTAPETYKDNQQIFKKLIFNVRGETSERLSDRLHIKKVDPADGYVVYESTAFLGPDGFRQSTQAATSTQQSIFLLGCSFTFGAGLADDETLETYLQKKWPNVGVKSAALGGWGPNDTLDFVTHNKEKFKDAKLVIYQMIDNQIERTTLPLDMYYVTGGEEWLNDKTNYEIVDGKLENQGSFRNSRPIKNLAFATLAHLPLLRYMNVTYPKADSQYSIEKVAAILAEIKNQIHEVSPNAKFVVALYPYAAEIMAHQGLPYLKKYNLEYVNLTDYDFAEATDHRMAIPKDGHPTKYMNYVLAELYSQLYGQSLGQAP
jgi:hypothetical protein